VYLKEDYSNDWAPDQNPEVQADPYIIGPAQLYPYDIAHYEIHNATGGTWSLQGSCAMITNVADNVVTIEVTSGRRGEIKLVYELDSGDDISYDISILSL
jgi:hypothetical protein